jgi:hypothetical protein
MDLPISRPFLHPIVAFDNVKPISAGLAAILDRPVAQTMSKSIMKDDEIGVNSPQMVSIGTGHFLGAGVMSG